MPLPQPVGRQVRVRVEASGLSAYDVMLRKHQFPGAPKVPYTPGEDIVGIVEALGPEVTGLREGQRVGGWTFGDGGGYAAHICPPEADLVPVPDGLDPGVAVGMIVNFLTARLNLEEAVHLKAGERLLVQGAGGGLGSALLQLARRIGATTFGCDSRAKHWQIEADGAAALDFADPRFPETARWASDGGMDAVVDVVGGPRQLLRSYRALRRGGRLSMLGMAGSERHGVRIILPSLAVMAALAVWPDGRRIATGPGMDTYPRRNPDWYRKSLAELFDLAAAGDLDPHICARVPLCEAARAHRMFEAGEVVGKLVLVNDG